MSEGSAVTPGWRPISCSVLGCVCWAVVLVEQDAEESRAVKVELGTWANVCQGLCWPGTAGWPWDRSVDPGLRDGPLSLVPLGALAGGYSCSKTESQAKGLEGKSWRDQTKSTFWLTD